MRLFIAITLDEVMKDALSEFQEDLYSLGVRGNYTSMENLHLTLAFIGEYSDTEAVMDAMEASLPEPAVLSLDGVGSFGKLWWVGLKKEEALFANSRRLRRALSDAGIPFDRKRFSPHITLVRKPVCKDETVLVSATLPKAKMNVQYISLMRSDRGKRGMVYTEIGRVYCQDRKKERSKELNCHIRSFSLHGKAISPGNCEMIAHNAPRVSRRAMIHRNVSQAMFRDQHFTINVSRET